MKVFLVVLILIHGLIHLIGFVKPVSFAGNRPAKDAFAFVLRISWFLTFILLFFTAYGFYQSNPRWWMLGFASIIASQTLVIIQWKDAKWGTVLNVIILLAVIMGFGIWKFDRNSDKAANEFLNFTSNQAPASVINLPKDLPLPVQNWLVKSGALRQPFIGSVRLSQKGKMKLGQDKKDWVETSSKQLISSITPAFIWTVSMESPPGFLLKGRDQFRNGKGNMLISAAGLFPIENESGSKLDQASLQRYVSEMCWLPNIALSPYIQWKSIDSLTAMATMTYKGTTGSVLFYFTPAGDIFKCEADRYMSGSDNGFEKWVVISRSWQELDGIRVPAISQVTWKLKSGDFTWYVVELKSLEVIR